MKRKKFVDVARGIAILSIVIGHTIIYCSSLSNLFKIIYAFNVPLFFFISGYLFNTNKKLLDFLKSKVHKLLIPYFIFSILFLIPYGLFYSIVNNGLKTGYSFNIVSSLKEIMLGIGANGALKQNEPLWFLPALFITELMFFVIYKIIEKIINKRIQVFLHIIIFLFLVVSGFVINLYQIIIPWGLSTFFTLGYIFELGYVIKRINLNISFLWSIIFIIIGGCISLINSNISYTNYIFGNYGLFLISSTLLVLGIIFVSKFINKNKLICIVGEQSIYIMIFHKIFIVFFQICIYKIFNKMFNNQLVSDIMFLIVTCIITLLSCEIIIKIIKKTKLDKFVFGS